MAQASNVNVANLLTLLRILLVPVFFMLSFYAYRAGDGDLTVLCRRLSVMAFAAIVLSDLADGYIARRWRIQTPLGTLLDPLADKLFVTTSFILLTTFGQLPAWLTMMVVTKDLLILLGWGTLFILQQSVRTSPSRMGKLCAVFQYATVCAVILRLPTELSQWFLWPLTALLTVLAFTGYAWDTLQGSKASSASQLPRTD